MLGSCVVVVPFVGGVHVELIGVAVPVGLAGLCVIATQLARSVTPSVIAMIKTIKNVRKFVIFMRLISIFNYIIRRNC
jgi:hypothetical protein